MRADASVEIGTGHVMRCLALAQAWQDAGGSAIFVLQHSTPAILRKLSSEGFKTLVISPGAHQDAIVTAKAATEHRAEWVVLDGYHFDNAYRSVLKTAGLKLLCIDDNGENCAFAEVILNSNVYAQRAAYGHALPQSHLLLGARFAMLRREFRPREEHKQSHRSGQRVLITMGGSDPQGLTEMTLQAIKRGADSDLEIRVATTSSNPRVAALTAYCRTHNTPIFVDGDMPELMRWADLAIAAAGTTCLELCFFGLPAIVIDAAPNQLPTARELDRRGLALHVPLSEATENRIAEKVRLLAGNPDIRERMSRAAEGLVDGRGAERVTAVIIAGSLTMRRAAGSDAHLFWEWTNDNVVRGASFKSAPVSWKEHEHWFTTRLDDPGSHLFVFEHRDHGVAAIVRFEAENSDLSKISITIGRESRGLGLAPHIIQRAVSAVFEHTQIREVRALIKPENSASLHAFRGAGFSFAGTTRVRGIEASVYKVHRTEIEDFCADAAEEVGCG